MNGWVMPAPAPWANTKQARAAPGRIRSAETAISSFCALTAFISPARYSPHAYSTAGPIRTFWCAPIGEQTAANSRRWWRDRRQQSDALVMLMLLANLAVHPESVPINLWNEVKGVPVDDTAERPDPIALVRMIAVARIMMPKSVVRLSAGRQYMTDELQALCFVAGANSIFIGDVLLTTKNPQTDRDANLLGRLGMTSKLDDAAPAEVQIAINGGVQAAI